jgi:hypothetical protein
VAGAQRAAKLFQKLRSGTDELGLTHMQGIPGGTVARPEEWVASRGRSMAGSASQQRSESALPVGDRESARRSATSRQGTASRRPACAARRRQADRRSGWRRGGGPRVRGRRRAGARLAGRERCLPKRRSPRPRREASNPPPSDRGENGGRTGAHEACSGRSRYSILVAPLVYDELRAIARAQLRRERAWHALEAAGLVHEACSRIVAFAL